MFIDGLVPLAEEYASMRMPMLLLNSPQDHVVEPKQSEFLVARYRGPIERIILERSFHVATLDYDKDIIIDAAVAFAQRVTGGV